MVKQLTLNIEADKSIGKEKIANREIKEEFTLTNATIYGGYNLFSDCVAQGGLDRLLKKNFRAGKRHRLRIICR